MATTLATLMYNWVNKMKYFSFDTSKLDLIKFIYSEKAKKFCEIFTLLLTTVHTVKVIKG